MKEQPNGDKTELRKWLGAEPWRTRQLGESVLKATSKLYGAASEELYEKQALISEITIIITCYRRTCKVYPLRFTKYNLRTHQTVSHPARYWCRSTRWHCPPPHHHTLHRNPPPM
jgi:hypothetical protein